MSFAPHPASTAGSAAPLSANARVILDNINFLIRHGERVALIGANGAGKSVLLRLILGKEQPTAGEIKIGPSVKVGTMRKRRDLFRQT
jgi:sulfate-transporting ATPase